MAYRGSLQQCITCAIFNLTKNGYPTITILHSHRGKYYTCTTPEHAIKLCSSTLDTHHIVFCGTLHELKAFRAHEQLALLTPTEENHEHPQNSQTRQQPHGDTPHQLASPDGSEKG